MRKRRLILAVVALAGLIAAAGVGLVALDRRRLITMEQYDRIQPGMTLAEVEAVLGLPPGDYASPDWPRGMSARDVAKGLDLDRVAVTRWVAECCPPFAEPGEVYRRRIVLEMRVFVDGRGKVISKDGHFIGYQSPSALEKVWDSLRAARAKLGF
jgi:hypothetical protein